VNVIGCIKTDKTSAAFATTGLALKLYRSRFGTIPIEVAGAAAPLDVAAAWTADRATLTIGIVNPTPERYELKVTIESATLSGGARLWRITGPDEMAYNEPGIPPRIVIEEATLDALPGKLIALPVSVTIYAFDVD
jgi:alpha-N-arabinofuranosidase